MKLKYLMTAAVICFAAACNNGADSKYVNSDSISVPVDTQDLAELKAAAALKKIHLCTELLPPPPPHIKMPYEIDTFYSMQELRVDTLKSIDIKPTTGYLAALNAYLWRNIDTVHVAFLDGNPTVQDRVRTVAKTWENYVGLIFDFNQTYSRPDITISFMYMGSWSHYGTYSRKVRPSMNFGWLDEFTSPEEYQRVVLHEFGHALGFIHEHLQPNANIPWNRQAVYDYYKRSPNFWDKEMVDNNIFLKYSKNQVNSTAYDPNSIMHYAIPPELTDGHFSVTEKNELSDLDKKLASELYPRKKAIARR